MRFFQFKFKQKKGCFLSQNMIQANKPYNSIYRFCDKSFFVIFTDNADGLCCKLQQMCMKPRSLIWAFDRGKSDEYATTRDTVLRVKKLGSGQFAEVWLGREVKFVCLLKVRNTNRIMQIRNVGEKSTSLSISLTARSIGSIYLNINVCMISAN